MLEVEVTPLSHSHSSKLMVLQHEISLTGLLLHDEVITNIHVHAVVKDNSVPEVGSPSTNSIIDH